MTKVRGFLCAAGSVALLFVACPALAGDAETARTLFKEARMLSSEGKYDQACPKFEQSLKLDPGLGTKFNLADCYEHVGRTATARKLFLEVAAIAREAGQGEREQVAVARAKTLEPQVHTLTIDVKGHQSNLTIKRDGTEIAPSAWGVPQPVDPGSYALEVSAPGKKPWSMKVDVPPSGDATVEVPELAEAGAAKEPEASAAPKAAEEAPPPAAPASATSETPPPPADLTVPLVIYSGLGIGAVLAGTALILYKSANDKAAGVCPSGTNCTTDDVKKHQGLVNDARDARTLAYVGLGVAGAAAITGGLIAVIRSSHKESPSQARLSAGPMFAPGAFGAAMAGHF